MTTNTETPFVEVKHETEETLEEKRVMLGDAVRKVLLAGIGAVTMAQDEVENLVNKLIERGEIAEQDGRTLITELTRRRKSAENVAGVDTEGGEEDRAEEKSNPFMEATRNVLLAGVGVVTLAQDEAEKFVNRLVERGELAERDGRSLLDDLKERRRRNVRRTEERLDQRLEDLLNKLNVPSKSDIDALSAKLNELTQKIDKLSQANRSTTGERSEDLG
jgi:poly(hydroxyalkanoate) granule-associated protein